MVGRGEEDIGVVVNIFTNINNHFFVASLLVEELMADKTNFLRNFVTDD